MKITTKQYPNIVKLMKSIYSDYKGRKFFVITEEKQFDVTSFWDGGSRTYFTFVRNDGKTFSLPHTPPWIQQHENRIAQLQPGLACIKHSFFCGHDCGLTLMLHPDDMPKFIEYKEAT